MKVQRIYIDTSVIGGCFDDEFAPWSKGLVKDFKLENFKPIVSELVSAEIDKDNNKRGSYPDIGAYEAEK